VPGIAGYVSLTTGSLKPLNLLSQLTGSLMHEPYYSLQPIPCPEESLAVIVNPDIDGMICGAAQDADLGLSLGFYGEFYDPEFHVASEGNDVAEILLRRYVELDEGFPHSLDGSYIIFIADKQRKRYRLFNDHYASRPVFYGTQGGRFYFSPEAKGVARMPGFDAGIDEDALVAFLINGNPLGERTFYKNVKPLPPGTVLTIEGGKVIRTESSRYAPCGETVDRGEDYYVEGLSALLLKAVGKQLRNPDKAFVPLSGGIDSRLIAGCVNRIVGERLHTVSWGVNESLAGSDTVIARQVADFLRSVHHFARRESEHFQRDLGEMLFRIDGLNDDPAFHSNELCIMRRIREEFGGLYVLRGEECFGHTPEPTCDLEALGHWGIARLQDHPRAERLLNPSKLPEFRDRSGQTLQAIIDTCPSLNFIDRRDYFYFACRLFHYHSRSAYCKRTVVDVRNPWLDKELLEFLQTVPVRYRINRYLYKKAGSALFPDLMAIPIATRSSLENWTEKFQNSPVLQQFLKTHLFEQRNSFHEMLNPDAVRALYDQAIRPGGSHPSVKQRTLQAGKNLLRTQAPQLYRRLKPSLMGRMESTEIAGEVLLMRMLLLKIWFDQFVDGNAQPEAFHLIVEDWPHLGQRVTTQAATT
jgi:asparagine synthetase B (glutamine-hydrolysing)